MSNPWKKLKAFYEEEEDAKMIEDLTLPEFVQQVEVHFGKSERIITRTQKDHEIGKTCIRAIKEFVQGKIKTEDMWSVINNRHDIANKLINIDIQNVVSH